MSASLNLASQPFRNRTLPWTVAGVITVASLLLLVVLISKSSETNQKAAVVEREADTERQQISALEKRADAIKQALTPEQHQTLQAAQALLDRKRFSWARLFGDLEAALPSSVRVKRISVNNVSVLGGRTVAQLQLIVASKNPADAAAMIGEMDRTGIFRAELVEQNLKTERNETVTESTLEVTYQPRGGNVTASEAGRNDVAATGGIVQAINVEPR